MRIRRDWRYDPNIVSVGDDWREWDPALRGTRDRVHAKREEETRRKVKALTSEPDREFRPLPVQLEHMLGAFSLDGRPSYRHQSARSKSIDMLLDRLGVPSRPRRPR